MDFDEINYVTEVWKTAYDVFTGTCDNFNMDDFLFWIVDDISTCIDCAESYNRHMDFFDDDSEPETWVDYLDLYQLIRYPLMEDIGVDAEEFVKITKELDCDYYTVLDDMEGHFGLTEEDYKELLSHCE